MRNEDIDGLINLNEMKILGKIFIYIIERSHQI